VHSLTIHHVDHLTEAYLVWRDKIALVWEFLGTKGDAIMDDMWLVIPGVRQRNWKSRSASIPFCDVSIPHDRQPPPFPNRRLRCPRTPRSSHEACGRSKRKRAASEFGAWSCTGRLGADSEHSLTSILGSLLVITPFHRSPEQSRLSHSPPASTKHR